MKTNVKNINTSASRTSMSGSGGKKLHKAALKKAYSEGYIVGCKLWEQSIKVHDAMLNAPYNNNKDLHNSWHSGVIDAMYECQYDWNFKIKMP